MNNWIRPHAIFVLAVAGLTIIGAANASGQELMKQMMNVQRKTPVRQGWARVTAKAEEQSKAVDSGTAKTSPIKSSADVTLPDLGDGFQVIPSPGFTYTEIDAGGDWGYAGRLWGNSLGVDSNLQKAAGNLLAPQISLVGLSFEGTHFFSWFKGDFKLGVDLQMNLLVKKVSYFDTSAKGTPTTTHFNPFVIHPKIGLTGFMKQWFYLSAYCNVLSVLTQNDKFSSFFSTHGKSNFVYPEIDAGGIFNITNSGKQQIKFEFDLLVNNGDVRTIYNSNDKVIPYIKVGFVSSL